MSDDHSAFRSAMLLQVGSAPEVIMPGRLHRFATRDRRGDDAGFCKLFDDLRGGVYGCNRQFPGQVFNWSPVDLAHMTATEIVALARQRAQAARDRKVAQHAQWRINAGSIATLWRRCQPVVADDPVALYLATRLRGQARPVPDSLRLHPALPYRIDGEVVGTWPAMVAAMTAADGHLLALHRTWLTSQGQKAPTPGPCKKLTPTAGRLAGACIRLGQPERGQIGIAEGIETALAARCASGVSTVAAYSAGALAAWHWPAGLRRLVIFADADKAGRDAAAALRARALAARLKCDVLTPTTEGADWCDVWVQRGIEQIGSEVTA